ncbi:MAG: dTMP kinase [Burkholderiales bacterium]|nr:dTMP kinase [Burkholderiales bacterium]
MRGKFITLEGVDGAGKSTHLDWIAARLEAAGKKVVVTREPGGTPLGEELRKLLLTQPMHLETETLLMFAARREHLERLILPALAAGTWVLSDRFTDATFAYQGGGRRLDLGKIESLENWVQQGLQPDLTLVFDLSVDQAKQRRLAATAAPDRFEQENLDFFARVRAVYLERAARYPQRIRVVDASRSIADIRKTLEEYIVTVCQ